MVRIGTAALAAALAVATALVAGCGGDGGTQAALTRLEGPFGTGANAYWIDRTAEKPRAVVVFFHGASEESLRPAVYREWLDYLARAGAIVVFPRYETTVGQFGALRRSTLVVEAARRRLGNLELPLVAVGYSRGGRLAVEYASLASHRKHGLAAVLSVFPSAINPLKEELVNLAYIDKQAEIEILVGDRDTIVRDSGARELVDRLRRYRFPSERVRLVTVRSEGSFAATHLSPLEGSEAAQRAYWEPGVRLIESAAGS